MSEAVDKDHDTLATIGQLAEQAVNGGETVPGDGLEYAIDGPSRTVQSLPPRLLGKQRRLQRLSIH